MQVGFARNSDAPDKQMTETYDVVVIGGGIHGAGIAQAASARGFSVMVLEQTGIASGTSSRSSKLIHGGLRYLESRQFSLVRECLRERTLLLELAPQLIELKPFYIPVYQDTTRRPWLLRAGLSLYAVLGGLHPATRFRRIPQDQWKRLDGLDTAHLEAVFQYNDAQTDDAALTRAVMRSAQRMGAQLKMPATFTSAHLDDRYNTIEYRHNGTIETCRATVLVNAAGPWVRQVLSRITPAPPQLKIELVQGTHIMVPGTLTQGIYYVEAQDERVVFVMPWQGNILVGTTESIYQGDPADVRPLPQETAYLMETLSHYFPCYRSGLPILEATAGLRVLPSSGDGTESSAVSVNARLRETVLQSDRRNRPRLLTVYGGKLTTYRLTAERVMAHLADVLPVREMVADTRHLKLT
ncbi:glycerol-3-phosphate dehydrogenase [Nitrosospira sp. Nsp13]|nr:glycerol-3-phosphate dehydrogenase [Nitrosospira sp. Nsp13]